MDSPISFSTSCSRISTNSRFANSASHSLFGNPTRISLCIEWPLPSEGTLKEDLKPAEEDFFAITAPCAAFSCQISQETVSKEGVRRKDALKRRFQTTPICRDGLTDSLITHLLGRENGRVLPRLSSYNAGPKGFVRVRTQFVFWYASVQCLLYCNLHRCNR